MFILFTLGRSLLIFVCYIFSVEEYISQKKDKFLVDPDPNLPYTKRKQARPSDSLAQMPPVLLSVFRMTTTMQVFLDMAEEFA